MGANAQSFCKAKLEHTSRRQLLQSSTSQVYQPIGKLIEKNSLKRINSNSSTTNSSGTFHSYNNDCVLKISLIPFRNSQAHKSIFIQKSISSLSTEINARRKTQSHYTQKEILNMLQILVYSLAYLDVQGQIYKDINTSNIYITDKSNLTLKLYPNILLKSYSFEHLANPQSSSPNWAPQTLQAYYQGRITPQEALEHLHKANVYSLGILMLHQIYTFNQDHYRIAQNVIRDRLLFIQSYYSECIARIIANMLDYEAEERMTLQALAVWLKREIKYYPPMKTSQNVQSTGKQSATEQPLDLHKLYYPNKFNVGKSKKQFTNHTEFLQGNPYIKKQNRQNQPVVNHTVDNHNETNIPQHSQDSKKNQQSQQTHIEETIERQMISPKFKTIRDISQGNRKQLKNENKKAQEIKNQYCLNSTNMSLQYHQKFCTKQNREINYQHKEQNQHYKEERKVRDSIESIKIKIEHSKSVINPLSKLNNWKIL